MLLIGCDDLLSAESLVSLGLGYSIPSFQNAVMIGCCGHTRYSARRCCETRCYDSEH